MVSIHIDLLDPFKKRQLSYGRRDTVHRGSADAQEVLRAEKNKGDIDGAYQDVEAAQGEAGKIFGQRRRVPVMGKARSTYCPRTPPDGE